MNIRPVRCGLNDTASGVGSMLGFIGHGDETVVSYYKIVEKRTNAPATLSSTNL